MMKTSSSLALIATMMMMMMMIMISQNMVQAQMGAPNQMNLSDPQVDQLVKRLSSFALTKIAEKRMTTTAATSQGGEGGNQKRLLSYSLVKVVSARSQVVSGVNYMLTFQMRDVSDCQSPRRVLKEGNMACTNGVVEQCNVTIWEQRWLNRTELTKTECSQHQTTSTTTTTMSNKIIPQLIGGRQRISNKDPEALKALDFAVSKLNQDAVNERAYFKPLQIFNTYKQIVSGVKYTYMIKLAPTNCEKHENLSILKTDDCVFVTQAPPSSSTTTTTKKSPIKQTNQNGVEVVVSIEGGDDTTTSSVPKSRNCKINVHDQPWLKPPQQRYKVTEVNCF